MTVVTSNVYGLWAAKQSAKASAASNGTKRFIQVGGDFTINRDDGSENFSDLSRFGDATDWINTIQGDGNPVIQAQPIEAAYLYWLMFGQETFTAAVASTTPAKHSLSPGATGGFYSTWWKRVGLSQIVRQQFVDCLITGINFEASRSTMVCHITPSILSLDPGKVATADPTTPAALSSVIPMLFTEVTGTITIDGSVYTAVNQYAVNITDSPTPWYGDSQSPNDLVPGTPSVTVSTTLLLNDQTLPLWNTQVYGTASPTAGTAPLRTLPALGSFSAQLVRGTLDAKVSIKHTLPKVKWTPGLAVPPNPDGGAIEIPLAGEARKMATSPIVVDIETGASDTVFSV